MIYKINASHCAQTPNLLEVVELYVDDVDIIVSQL